jgi:hypothetical protein
VAKCYTMVEASKHFSKKMRLSKARRKRLLEECAGKKDPSHCCMNFLKKGSRNYQRFNFNNRNFY